MIWFKKIKKGRGVTGCKRSYLRVYTRVHGVIWEMGKKADMEKELYLICLETEAHGVPEEIKILPLGKVKSSKGDFVVDQESFEAMKAEFDRRGIDVVVDYEHQTLADVQAPAGGWIKELKLADNAIMAKVEWTEKAKGYLRNKEYKYLSPVILARKSDKKAVMLHSVALTNTPAIDGMFPIVNKNIDLMKFVNGVNELDEGLKGEKKMELTKIIELLGLTEEATEDDVLKELKEIIAKCGDQKTEVVANKTICDLLGVAEAAKTEDVAASIMALKNDKKGYVPESEFKALKERLDKKDASELVMRAMKEGKISAAQKEWAMEYACKDTKGFASFAEKAPQAVPMGELGLEDVKKKVATEDETTMKVCKMLKVSKEDVDKYGKDDE